jgi:thymidylate synthase ThyX
LTNVGVTANARVLEHAISKLLSSELAEERDLGLELREQGHRITPTLIKYADPNPYLQQTAQRQRELAAETLTPPEGDGISSTGAPALSREESAPTMVRLLEWDGQAEEKLAAALLYRQSSHSYDQTWRRVLAMDPEERQRIIDGCLAGMGPHDAPVRELELVGYTLEFLMDYGAYREFKRHRMQSYIPQPLTVAHGYRVPQLVVQAGLEAQFHQALEPVDDAYRRVYSYSPPAAQYLVTHAHYRRVLTRVNLRECYHLFKLRTSQLAHFSIREPMLEAMRLAVDTHPRLFRHLRLRDYPEWWPFPTEEAG